jgi:hypothetical protein
MAPAFQLRLPAVKRRQPPFRHERGRGLRIHGYAERVERYLALIAGSSIPEEDKKALTEFGEVLRAQGLHIGRVMKYLYHLRKLRNSPHNP